MESDEFKKFDGIRGFFKEGGMEVTFEMDAEEARTERRALQDRLAFLTKYEELTGQFQMVIVNDGKGGVEVKDMEPFEQSQYMGTLFLRVIGQLLIRWSHVQKEG